MSAQDRIAAVLATVQPPDPEWVAGIADPPSVPSANWPGWALALLAADPTLAQDIEDGRALRELRASLDDGGWHPIEVRWWSPVSLPTISAVEIQVRVRVRPRFFVDSGNHPTIAEAADACRKALEARRG